MTDSALLQGLNASQREAVTHIEGPLLILAGPGSGKTRVITHRIAYMLESGVSPESILALTFTNKAAQEMRSRLEALVGPSNVWLGTFHGFCVRLLRRYARIVGLPENFSIYDTNDSEAALKSAVKESKFELTHVSLGALANKISYLKNRLVTPEILETETLSSEEYQVGQVYPFYQRVLLQSGAVDFDDILMHTALLLRTHPEIRQQLDERLRFTMVDEYQDTNLAQYVIVRHLSVDHPNLAATGDPDQSIYGWRGANLKNITNFERDFPELSVVRLEENYRSTPQILSVADCLIQCNEFRKSKNLVPSRNEGSKVRLAMYPTARNEAENIGDQIETLTSTGESEFRDFGVLYRTNAHSRLLEQALIRRQIPYQLIGGFRFYMRKEIKDLVAYLLILYNPDDNIALQRAINTPARGIGKQTIAKVEGYASRYDLSLLEACRHCADNGTVSSKAAKAIGGFLKLYDQLSTLVHGPLVDLLQSAIELTKYREHLQKLKGGEEEIAEVTANLDELLAEAHELDEEADDERPALETFLEFAALQSDSDRLKTDSNVVTLMTLHAAKGLEFPRVFITAVEENILPHSRSKDDPMSLEEERRLLFVGITRAQDHLQISYAKSRGFASGSSGSGVPSSFLIELPRDELHLVDMTGSYGGFNSSGSTAFDHSGNGEWDEWSQVEEYADTSGGDIDFDDCQLPPEEIQARVSKPKLDGLSLPGSMMLGSDMLSAEDENDQYQEGCIVSHEKFGPGEIIASSGRGPKRAVTVSFLQDGTTRTFRLSHVDLRLEPSES